MEYLNELLLLFSVVFVYGGVLLFYRLFGKSGLFVINAAVTLLANIEVLILIYAFGMEQTLGNVMFAATFLVTDILSETEDRKTANRAVYMGILVSLFFLLTSQLWLLYQPAEADWVMPSMKTIFTMAPRVMFASLSVYAISQLFDVWLYHKWWKFTERISGSKKAFLWLRNNGSTMISQLINTVLYTLLAFSGLYEWDVLISIMISSYIIFFVTSLLDTPVLYLARRIRAKKVSA